MKIDLHTHILPKEWPDLEKRFGYGGWVRLQHDSPCKARMLIGQRVFREIQDNCWSAAKRLEDCAACGVETQVLSTVPVMFSYWAKPADTLELARLLNDHIAGVVAEHPRRFAGLGTLPMQDPQLACQELERCVRELRLSGVQIGTHVGGNNLDHPDVCVVFQRAAELGAAVFVHPWDMLAQERMQQYWLSWLVGMPAETTLAICSMIFGGVFERWPELRVCFAHGGGSLAATIGRIEHGYHARPDLCAKSCRNSPAQHLATSDGAPARFWVDSLTHDRQTLLRLIELLGDERVVLGSDYPFPLGEARPGELIESMPELSQATRERLLWRNALDFLRWDPAPHGL